MQKSEDTSSMETASDFIIEMMTDEKDGEEFTREYLRAMFLSSVGRSLYYARCNAGLTQAELAERIHTTQSAIARFEADRDGSMSFRKYVDFVIACGMMPRSLMLQPILEPIDKLRDEMIRRAQPEQQQGISIDWQSFDVQIPVMDTTYTQLFSNPVYPYIPLNTQNSQVVVGVTTLEKLLQQYSGVDINPSTATYLGLGVKPGASVYYGIDVNPDLGVNRVNSGFQASNLTQSSFKRREAA